MNFILLQDKEKKAVYFLFCLGCITISFNVAAITAVVPSISANLNLSDFLVSKIIPYYMVPYGIGALVYAPMTRILSYRKVIAGSMSLFAVTCFVCVIANSINSILIARIAMGLTGASIIPLGLMIIGDCFDKDVRGRLVGFFFSCSFFASLAGIVISGVANWRLLFLIPAILAVLLTLISLLLKSEMFDNKHKGEINYIKAFSNIKIRNVFIFIFIISALYHGVHKWFGIYLDRIYHLDQFTISSFFVLSAIGGFAGQNIGGMISDKKGRLAACYIGFTLLAASVMLLYGKYPVLIVAVIMAFISMGWTISHNGVSTILTDFPEQYRPIIASLNSAVRFISGGIGFYISSYFVKRNFGLTFLIIGISIFILVFLIKYIIIYQEK